MSNYIEAAGILDSIVSSDVNGQSKTTAKSEFENTYYICFSPGLRYKYYLRKVKLKYKLLVERTQILNDYNELYMVPKQIQC